MGCIEIISSRTHTKISITINSNMGCIEMKQTLQYRMYLMQINSNMGCIEIQKIKNLMIVQ